MKCHKLTDIIIQVLLKLCKKIKIHAGGQNPHCVLVNELEESDKHFTFAGLFLELVY